MKKQSRAQQSEAQNLIYPIGPREIMKKKGMKVKDFHKDNVKSLKKKEEEFAKKQKDAEESKKESNWKLNKFKSVEPLVLKDKEEVAKIKQSQALNDERERKLVEEKLKKANDKNYLKRNMLQQQPKKSEVKPKEDPHTLNPNYGKVPK
eukprot:TRINITY_DN6916_c0_g1_i6.p1 TRINITY_DN6916_c0_g1~~TRINITY_DN6916_c0_g1_i6.p1  ORF type:complete len:149 (-),score=68.54 TRINITY_DN6916_c0_g1_i6:434-880(-)